MEEETKDEGLTEEGKTEESTTEPSSAEATEAPEESTEDAGYQFDDDLTSSEPPAASAPRAPQSNSGGGGGGFAEELFSKTIHAKFRTFYVDLKESKNGKFVKISEKSRGRKSTVMMDQEDVPAIIEALQEVEKQF